MLTVADHDADGSLTSAEMRALSVYDLIARDADRIEMLDEQEFDGSQPELVQWASRPCLEFGVAEGMLLDGFCGQ